MDTQNGVSHVNRRTLVKWSAAAGVVAATRMAGATRSAAYQQDQTGSPGPSRVVSPPEVFVSGYDSPEGPAFDREGNLFFVNWLSSSILKVTPEGDVTEFYNTGGIPAGLAFHPDGSLYIADEGDDIHGIMKITPDGEASILVNDYEGAPLNGANDLVFDQNGVLYFSDPWGSWLDNPIGGFYRYFPDGTLEQIDMELAFPNGVALRADGSAVFLAETGHNRVLRYAIGADGDIGPREEWTVLDLAPGGPDGMAFDEQGDLYIAHYGSGHVDVVDPAGETVEQIELPGAELTNVAFGGEGNRTLVVTDVATASVYTVALNIAGQPLHDGRSDVGA